MQPRDEQQQGGQQFYQPEQQGGYIGAQAPEYNHPTPGGSVEWEASEYIHHEKGAGWILLVVIVALVAAGIAVWFKQWLFAVLIVVMAATFGFYGFRRPRTMHYSVNDVGVEIGSKKYDYGSFRAFGVVPEGAFYSISLIPTQRFSPAVNIYFAESDGEKIVDILGDHLPMEEMHSDLIDVIMRKLRF